MSEGKDPKKSKTVIFGIIVTLLPLISKLSPMFAEFITSYQDIIISLIGIFVIVLRKLTGNKIDLDKIFKFG